MIFISIYRGIKCHSTPGVGDLGFYCFIKFHISRFRERREMYEEESPYQFKRGVGMLQAKQTRILW